MFKLLHFISICRKRFSGTQLFYSHLNDDMIRLFNSAATVLSTFFRKLFFAWPFIYSKTCVRQPPLRLTLNSG